MVYDYDSGNFISDTSGNMAMDSNGNMMMKMSDNMAMDMNSGELHITSSWSSDDEDD